MTHRGGSRTAEMEAVRARFEQWRQSRGKEGPIPVELWAAAVALARREGIYRTAAALRLNGVTLKRHVLDGTPTGQEVPPAAFVELLTAGRSPLPEYTLELEGGRGKLRIQAKGASAAEMASLSRVLWEVAR